MRFIAISLLLAALVSPHFIQARTWTVEQDGSGDYMEIQDAVDAAAVGDTILIGAGRYDTFHHVPGSGGGEDYAIIHVETDSLTLRGVDRDQVIIGPATRHQDRLQFQGIIVLELDWIDIENITIENIHIGAQVSESGRVADCAIRSCSSGLLGAGALKLLVENCEFVSNSSAGVNIFAYGHGHEWAIVRNCTFINELYGGVYTTHPNTTVDQCSFTDPIGGGVQFAPGGSGSVVDSHFSGGNYGIYIGEWCTAEVSNCTISNSVYAAVGVTAGLLLGSGNVLHGDGSYTISLANGEADFHGNHIMPGADYTVHMTVANDPELVVDLTNNYWGTASADSISAWIWDGEDDPLLETIVQFEPFSQVPVRSEQSSFGDLKRMFR